MKPIAVPEDDHVRVEFNIPRKDADPVTISLPRFDFIDEDELDEIQEQIDGIDKELPNHRQQRESILVQVRPFVTDSEYELVSRLKLGQLAFLMQQWTEKSAMPLGEFLASVESSTESTGKRSGRTSSTKDGADRTSAGD